MSYRITLKGNRRAATRFVGAVRRKLVLALAQNEEIRQTDIADMLEVHRSVINRQLKGTSDMSLGRAAEIAWALGYRPKFELEKVDVGGGVNREQLPTPIKPRITSQTSSSTGTVVHSGKKLEIA